MASMSGMTENGIPYLKPADTFDPAANLQEMAEAVDALSVESGYNLNGIWVRYASGIQICYKQIEMTGVEITKVAGSYYYGGNWSSGPYAQSFVSNGSVMVTATAVCEDAVLYCDSATRGLNINSGQCSGFLTRPTPATIEKAYVNLTAVGMWK